MSTDAGSAAAPEDTATRAEAGERPGLESSDPQSDDSATSTAETADRGVEGSAPADEREEPDSGTDSVAADSESDAASADSDAASTGTGRVDDGSDGGGFDPAQDGFVASLLRDSTITGLPGETGAPPAEPHAPQAQQEGDEPVGSEPPAGDNPDGVD
jgi:hypothetical protein